MTTDILSKITTRVTKADITGSVELVMRDGNGFGRMVCEITPGEGAKYFGNIGGKCVAYSSDRNTCLRKMALAARG